MQLDNRESKPFTNVKGILNAVASISRANARKRAQNDKKSIFENPWHRTIGAKARDGMTVK